MHSAWNSSYRNTQALRWKILNTNWSRHIVDLTNAEITACVLTVSFCRQLWGWTEATKNSWLPNVVAGVRRDTRRSSALPPHILLWIKGFSLYCHSLRLKLHWSEFLCRSNKSIASQQNVSRVLFLFSSVSLTSRYSNLHLCSIFWNCYFLLWQSIWNMNLWKNLRWDFSVKHMWQSVAQFLPRAQAEF